MTFARGYPTRSPFAICSSDTVSDRQARADAAARELWHGKGLALIDPEDFDSWLIREAIIAVADKKYGKRGKA